MNLIKLSIQRPIFIFMVTLFFIVLGALSLKKIPIDLYPSVSYPVLSVSYNFPGAAPEEVEQLVTKPVEDVLSGLAGVKTIRSSSREGSSVVTMEFEVGSDIRYQEVQVRAKVANMQRSLPDTLSEPVVYRQDTDDIPVIEIAVTGNRTTSELSDLANDIISERLRQVDGVGIVDVGGDRKKEILVALNQEKLEAFHINATTIATAIGKFNGNNPIGRLDGQNRTWLLRSISPIKNITDLRSIPVAKSAAGDPIFLKDIASISQGFSRVNRINFFNDGKSLRPAVILSVSKQSGENTVDISNKVQKSLKDLRDDLPQDVLLTVTRDNAELIRTNINDVFESLILGALLTIMVVLLFLRSPRATITTGLSLPSSVITTFAVMFVAGFTINVMTLLALSLAIGLLVDDAIVVRENIWRHLRLNPDKPAEASYVGTKEVSMAVVGTTLTIVAVFLPVGFMGGTTGQFFKQFAVSVVFAVLISLWDALTMAPMLSTYFANIADPSKEWAVFGKLGRSINYVLLLFEEVFSSLERGYKKLLSWLLVSPWTVFFVTVSSLAVSVWGFKTIHKSFIPTQLGNIFSASLVGPLALPVERIADLAKEVDQEIRKVPGLDNWSISASVSQMGNASISFTLRTKENAAQNQDTLAKVRTDVRQALQGWVGYSVRVSEPADPLAGTSNRFQPVAVLVSGDEIQPLKDLALQVQNIMKGIEGITDMSPLQNEGLPEIQLQVSPLLAGYFNVDSKMIAGELATWVEGDTRNSLQVGKDRIPIRVLLKDGDQLTPPNLMAKSIFTQARQGKDLAAIPLSGATTLRSDSGPTVISRENRHKIMRVGANIARGAPLGNIVAELKSALKELPLPTGYGVKIVGQNEQMEELFSNIIIALLLGCLFMYMILASLFESFAQPITVMAAIPLAATGAVSALLLYGMPLDIYGGIGMILLAGIVAKNSILLIDFASQRVRDEGLDPYHAILESAPLRLRPIMMTSVAMIMGMIPVAAGLGSGGFARQSLGITTIGGIVSSTFLTLLVIPSFYVLIEKISRRRRAVK